MRRSPLLWVKRIFGDKLKLTSQQESFLIEFGKLISAKLKASKGEELSLSDQEYATKMGVSVMSGNGTGKDFIAALTTLFWLDVFPYPKIVCTAPTSKQLKDVLWSEIAKLMRQSFPDGEGVPYLNDKYEHTAERVYLKSKHLMNHEKEGKEWFAVARTISTSASPEEQGETLAGFHADCMLVIADEASAIPEPVFKPLERTLTGALNIALLIFNPTRSTGYALDSQYGDSKRWVTLQWSAEDSELVSKESIRMKEDSWGRDSNPFRISVLGLPPKAESDALIPWEWIQDSVNRPLEIDPKDPIILGVDVGGGGDKSVIITRQGGQIAQNILRNSSRDTMEVAGWVNLTAIDTDPQSVNVDTIGLGAGVADRLREMGCRVRAVDSRATAIRDNKFYNKRTEMYWNMREAFENKSISIPDNKELINQLGAIKYKIIDSSGKVQIVKKDIVKKAIGHSPDEADALALTYAYPDRQFRKNDKYAQKYSKYDRFSDDETTHWSI